MFPDGRFHFSGLSAPSGVADQPVGDPETLAGARNRAQAVRRQCPEADFWVGIEGGVAERERAMDAFAWIVILSRSRQCEARTATFELPPAVVELVRAGVELGDADDQIFRRQNSKQGNGAVGLLTGDLIGRTDYYSHAVMLALVAEKNPDIY